MTDKFSYSLNGEFYYGEFETRDAAVAEAEEEGAARIRTGRNRKPEINLYCLSADSVIEDIVNQDDFLIDAADGWPGATKEQEDELTELLQQTFRDWMARHNLAPTFWVVEDVIEHGEPK